MAKQAKNKNAVDVVVDYTAQVENLISEYQVKSESSEKSVEEKENAFFEIGKKLHQISKELADKKKFTELKTTVAKRIGKNRNNIDKVVKVATFIETDNYKKYHASLPSSWGALYLVSSLDEEKLSALMTDEKITSAITRDELAEKIRAIKNPDKKTNQRITIVIEGGVEATNDELLKLKKYLKREFKVWKITSPEIEEEKNNS
jgi:hypothetical protein